MSGGSGGAESFCPEKDPLVWGRTRDDVSHVRGWQLRGLKKRRPAVSSLSLLALPAGGEWWAGVG